MDTLHIVLVSFCLILLCTSLFFIIQEIASHCRKKYLSPSASPSSSCDDLERQSTSTRTKTDSICSRSSSDDTSILLPPLSPPKESIYIEIPIVVKPLGPPRTVEKVGVISSQRVLTEEDKQEEFMQRVRRAQSCIKTISRDFLKCNLVIGVCSSPTETIGGYCINLGDNSCQMYTYYWTKLPWQVENENDPEVEVSLNNLRFALMLWEDEIIQAKKIRVYVGNSLRKAYKGGEALERTFELLRHYQNCKKVKVVNDGEFCVEGQGDSVTQEDFGNYVKFIQPAKDLGDCRIKTCERFLLNLYDIEETNVEKTHRQMKWNKVKGGPLFESTCAYNSFLEKVQAARLKWSTPCPKCGYKDG